jgi:hypothetical protein
MAIGLWVGKVVLPDEIHRKSPETVVEIERFLKEVEWSRAESSRGN